MASVIPTDSTPKVVAGTAGASVTGSLTVVLVYVLSELGVILPPEVASAVTTLVAAAGALFFGRRQAEEVSVEN